jgi:uncharacterized protein with WD repeat
MIKRSCILFTAILTGLIFLSVGTFAVAATAEPDKVVEIENKGYKKDKKRPVPFDHEASHESRSEMYRLSPCVQGAGENTWKKGDEVQKCSKCHDPKGH